MYFKTRLYNLFKVKKFDLPNFVGKHFFRFYSFAELKSKLNCWFNFYIIKWGTQPILNNKPTIGSHTKTLHLLFDETFIKLQAFKDLFQEIKQFC